MNSMSSTVDSSLLGQLHSKDRPSFFIPGITGRARCLSTKSKSEPLLLGRSVFVDLEDFRARKLRSSCQSAPSYSSLQVVYNDNYNNNSIQELIDDDNDGKTMEMAQLIHDSVLDTIMETRYEKECRTKCSSYTGNKSDTLLNLLPLSSLTNHSFQAIYSLEETRDGRKSSHKTKETITSLSEPLIPESQNILTPMIKYDDSAKSTDSDSSKRNKSKVVKGKPLLSAVPSPTGVAVKHAAFDMHQPSCEFGSLEFALSPSQKPRSSFLPQHLLLTPTSNSCCFQPFDADDALPGSWIVPPPPPLLGGDEWEGDGQVKSIRQNSVPKTDDTQSKKKEQVVVLDTVKTIKIKEGKTKKPSKRDTKLKRKTSSKKSSKDPSNLAIVTHSN